MVLLALIIPSCKMCNAPSEYSRAWKSSKLLSMASGPTENVRLLSVTQRQSTLALFSPKAYLFQVYSITFLPSMVAVMRASKWKLISKITVDCGLTHTPESVPLASVHVFPIQRGSNNL
ncbi:exo-alpha-sialidase [Trypanosoma cruzi]|nr:exo-alpha-sialidase [Trypanosoma cruzi]